MSLQLRSTSPGGRYQILVNQWEAGNSLWVESPVVFDTIANVSLLVFDSDLWSLDQTEWKSETQVRLVLRKYPGNHLPPQVVADLDCQHKMALVESARPVTFQELEAALDSFLSWR
ncbi:hypothetical protein [Methylibium rhizosphaerae]|uniref:hypothetical protein n=1 Tax=Methylibium rhizosphaerae TaxID=2570323 RepID=UPI00112B0B1B|nr:hypothetical protein [Methylibium rhizosphaerae]